MSQLFGTPLEGEDDEYTTVNNITEISAISGTEKVHIQDTEDNDWSASVNAVSEYALGHTSQLSEPVYNTDEDIFPVIIGLTPGKQKLGKLSEYISEKTVTKLEAVCECDTVSNAEEKEITLDVIPSKVTVNFIHGNTYGDVTVPVPSYPKLVIKNSNNEVIATLDICDARGHYAGTGCWNDDDYIDFQIIMTGETSGKARITNSDIRQASENYAIKADGFIKLLKITETETPTGVCWHNGKMKYIRTITAIRNGGSAAWSFPSDELFPYIDELLYARMEKHTNEGTYTSDAKALRQNSSKKIEVYMRDIGYVTGDKLVILYTKND